MMGFVVALLMGAIAGFQLRVGDWYEIGVGFLYLGPIVMAAIELGVVAAVVCAGVATAIAVVGLEPGALSNTALAVSIRSTAYLGVGLIVGLYSTRTHRLLRELERAALTDPLTGSANRRAFFELADDLVRRGKPFCVYACDVDGLKRVNDRHGHAAGDELLRRAATTLHATFHGMAVVARVGGDEFLCLEQTREPRAVWIMNIASGTARYPDDGHTIDQVIATADQRLYHDKQTRTATRRITDRQARNHADPPPKAHRTTT